VFVISPDPASGTAWGNAKQAMNTTLGALSGNEVARTFFYVGTPQDFLAGKPTLTGHPLYDRISRGFASDAEAGLRGFSADPVVIRLDVDNVAAPAATPGLLTQIRPGVSTVVGAGSAPFSQTAANVATRAAAAEARKLRNPSGVFGNVGHLLRNILGLFLILVLPGLIASRWFGLEDLPTKLALIPGLSVSLILGAGVLVVAVHRAPFGPADGWATLALALIAAGVLAFLARTKPALVRSDVVVVPDAEGPEALAAAEA
jgi:hypothetical protein